MMERGYLDSREMSAMFSLLRSNDLIWANVVNNYLMGNPPPAFDLLYWNSDGTRMARAAHSWYLRNTYVENNLIKPGHDDAHGRADRPRPDRSRTSTRWVPRRTISCRGTRRGASPSCRRPGAVRAWPPAATSPAIDQPPGPKKGAYWVDETGRRDLAGGVAGARPRHEGSWWTDWIAWLGERSGEKVSRRRSAASSTRR